MGLSSKRPSVLVLMADQLRHDALQHAGNSLVSTPNLDRLALASMRFRQAVTSTPICMAARFSFLTGRRAAQTQVVENSLLPGAMPIWPTIMTVLGEAGYRTHGVGKFHFNCRPFGFHGQEVMEEAVDCVADDDYLKYLRTQGLTARCPQGLRDLLYFQPQTSGVPLEHSQNEWVATRSIAFLREHARYRADRPFMLWSSWIAPHPPFAPVEPYDSLYNPDDMPLPVYADRPMASLPSPAWPHRGRLDGAHLDAPRMRRIRSLYYGQVTHVDHAIGRVLQTLADLGVYDNTIVLFVSDHGEMLGDHGLSQKGVPYEPSVRIPMFLRWPGKTRSGGVCDDLVSLTDFLPTLIEELKLPYPDGLSPLSGESLVGRAGGGLAKPRQSFSIDYGQGDQRWVCVRDANRKYVFWASGGREEAYDLSADPLELHNLIDNPPNWVDVMRRHAMDWEREQGLGERSINSDGWKVYPEPPLPPEDYRRVTVNDGRWADKMPKDEPNPPESHAQAFTRAIKKEATLDPAKLSIRKYLDRGGDLKGTPWEARG